MTFDGPVEKHVGKATPPSGDNGFNGPELLSQHRDVVAKLGDKQVAGNPNFEVGPVSGSDASLHRSQVATIVPDVRNPEALQASRDQYAMAGRTGIDGVTNFADGNALMNTFNQQGADIQAQIDAIARIQKLYT